MKKFLVMVMVMMLVVSMAMMCITGYADGLKNPSIVGTRQLVVKLTDAYIVKDFMDNQKNALCIEFEISNNADHERVFQCHQALINKTSEVSAVAWVSVGAHAVKNDSITVSLKEARMEDVSALTHIVLKMSVCDTSGDNAFKEVYIEGGPKAEWIKEKVAAHNQQDLGRWQNH